MIKVKDGYAKLVGTTASGSASHILLSNGGVKAVSDFAMADGTNATGTWSIDISGNAKSSTLSLYLLTGVGSECDANTLAFSDHLLRWYSSIPSTSSNLPTVTGWLNGLLALPLHSNGVTAQLYFSATKALFYRSMASDDWHQIAFTDLIPTVTNYYWANIAISSSKSTTTTPTFGSVTVPLSGLIVGSKSTDTSPTRVLMCYDTTLVTKYINIGNDPSAGNAGEFHYTYSASASASNNVGMGFYSGNRLKLYYNGGSGVGKVVIASAASGGTEYELLHLGNYKNYVDDMYWANVKVSSTSNATTKPTFSNTIVNGVLTVNGGAKTLTINHNHTLSTAWNDFITCLNPNLTATYHTAHITFGRIYDSKNVGYIGFKYAGNASNNNMVTIGLHSVDNVLNILASGNVGIGTISPSYKLHVAGDTCTSGWSRADNGFYVEGKGVHYMSNNANGLGQIYLTSNEFNWSASGAALYFNYRASANGTTVTSYVWNAGSSSSYASHSLGNLYIKTATLSTTLPTYDNAPLKFNATANNNDASNSRYQPWISGKDSVNSYGYGVTVSTGIYRDPGYSSGGYYIGCGWDGNANSVMWKFSRNGYLYGNFSGYLNGTAYSADAIKDSNNGTRITACYSTGGFSSNPSWLAAWNGYHLTYVSPGVLSVNYANSAGNADTVDNLHASDFVRAYGTFGTSYSYDSDWGLSIVTFDPVVSGTAPAQNPNISILNIGNAYYRRKQLAFTYSTNDIYYRRRIDSSWSGWVRLAISGESYTKSESDSRFINASGDTMTGTLYIGDSKHYLQYYTGGKYVELYNVTAATGIGVWDTGEAKVFNSNGLYKIWHEGNDGSGSGLDADTVDGVHASSLSQIKYIGNTSDFCYDVILLCKRDVAHSARLDGLLFTTGGGVCRYHCADAHFWHSCWSVGSYDTQKSISNKGYDGYGFEFCTCTYGGAVWYAIKLNRIQAVSYFFMGDWDNINWTLITYYHTSQGVKNSEIYNSISNLTSTPLRYSGSIYAHHFYESSDRLLKTNIVDINSSDNIPQLKEFDWKEDGSHSYGLIALELELMGYPELVNNSGSHKTVNYSAALSLIVGKLLVKIQEIEKENKELRDEINNLKTNKLWQS